MAGALSKTALAPTGNRSPLPEVLSDCDALSSAIAPAVPASPLVYRVGIGNDFEPAELPAGQVDPVIRKLFRRENERIRLSGSYPSAKPLFVDSGNLCPFRDGLGLAVLRNVPVAPHVPALLFTGRPSAVLGRVSSGSVDPVDRVSKRRALSHIPKEVLEVAPLVADSDASAAVAPPCRIVLVRAAASHRSPRGVGQAPSVLTRFRMPVPRHFLAMVAPTTGMPTGPKISSERHRGLPAIAPASPSNLHSFIRSTPKDFEPAKPFSRQVNKSGHSISSAIVYLRMADNTDG